MLVMNNLLYLDENTQAAFSESKNSGPDLQQAHYIIIHYTAGSSAQAAIDRLRNDKVSNRVSAHLVISRSGEITQLVPFDKVAWHSGFSYWENERDINRTSIGIELDNEGWYRKEDGDWISSFNTSGQAEDVEELTHPKHEKPLGWRTYPQEQWQAALEACQALRAANLAIVEVLGHEDIHQDKTDPGPAFHLDQFRAALFPERIPEGAAVKTLPASIEEYQTIRAAPIYKNDCRDHTGAIVRFGPPPVLPTRHPASPLPEGTKIKVTRTQIDKENDVKWSLVQVKSKEPKLKNAQGWVKTEHLKVNRVKSPAILYTDTGWIPKPETPRHPARTLHAGTRVRRMETQKPWVLVCTLEKIPSHGFVYAWLRESDIQPV